MTRILRLMENYNKKFSQIEEGTLHDGIVILVLLVLSLNMDNLSVRKIEQEKITQPFINLKKN